MYAFVSGDSMCQACINIHSCTAAPLVYYNSLINATGALLTQIL
jgi:hypothetical protein